MADESGLDFRMRYGPGSLIHQVPPASHRTRACAPLSSSHPAGSRRGKKSIVITFDSSTALLGTSVKLRCRP
jgi:hypothetical protein